MESLVVKSMNIKIELDGKITHVIGPTNSGKTLLLKKLINVIPNKDIYIDNKNIKEYDIKYLKNNIVVCLNDEVYNTPTVYDELSYNLSKLGYSTKDIVDRVKKIVDYFDLEDISKSYIKELTIDKRILVKILSYLIIQPSIFGCDNLFPYLLLEDKIKLYKYIKKKHISFINVISDLDDALYGDNVLIMNHFKCILSGSNKVLIDNNSIMPYMGIRLPFIVDLSQNLILYNIIDKVYVDKNRLVKKIWK